MMTLNASTRIQASRFQSMLVGYQLVAYVDDMEKVTDRLDHDAKGASFQFKRTVKNLIELAPVLTELAGVFRLHGFKAKSPTHFVDGKWVADVKIDKLTITVDFKIA